MVETVEIMEAGAKPALCKCATKSIIMATDTGKVGTMPNDWKNPTSYGHARSYCALDECAKDAMSRSTESVRRLGRCGTALSLVRS